MNEVKKEVKKKYSVIDGFQTYLEEETRKIFDENIGNLIVNLEYNIEKNMSSMCGFPPYYTDNSYATNIPSEVSKVLTITRIDIPELHSKIYNLLKPFIAKKLTKEIFEQIKK